MTKRYFLRYSEPASELVIVDKGYYSIKTSFSAGCIVSAHGGFSKKSGALDWAAKINAALGRTVATYAGAFETSRNMAPYKVEA